MTTIINRQQLNKICKTRESTIKWCQDIGLLPSSKLCAIHGEMNLTLGGNGLGRFRCSKGSCKGKNYIQLAKGTLFEKAKLPPETILSIIYSFAYNDSYKDCRREAILIDDEALPSDQRLSQETIAHWFNIAHEAIVEHFADEQEEHGKIGGPSEHVQIDESKAGKRKFNKGRRTEGHWIMGMIADNSEDIRLVLCPNNKRTAAELLPIIEKHVAEGSIIRTDLWKAYKGLSDLGYGHKTVNHSDKYNPFVAPDGTHTNRIEASWRPMKDFFRNVHLQSVCSNCEAKLNEAGEDAKMRAFAINKLQEDCDACTSVEKPCNEHKAQLKEIKTQVRKEIRQLYNARAGCEACQDYAEKFADKLLEYLWRRKLKKEGNYREFMDVLAAIKETY